VADVVQDVCVSCGKARPLKFCEHCGEKRISRHDYSIVHFAEHIVENLTHFDFRSLNALVVLMAWPGELTHAYLDGRRRVYANPIQIFVIVNLIYAVIGGGTFKTPLFVQERDAPYAAMKRTMVARAIEHSGKTRTEFTAAFDTDAGVQAKTWIFAMIPAFALVLAVLYGFRRYFFEHLVFATHFMAAFLVILTLSGLAVTSAFGWAWVPPTSRWWDPVASIVTMTGAAVYFYIAVRRTYGDGRVAAVVRTAAFVAAIFPVILWYRFLLFFVTLETLHV
jgi:hypothetical protein